MRCSLNLGSWYLRWGLYLVSLFPFFFLPSSRTPSTESVLVSASSSSSSSLRSSRLHPSILHQASTYLLLSLILASYRQPNPTTCLWKGAMVLFPLVAIGVSPMDPYPNMPGLSFFHTWHRAEARFDSNMVSDSLDCAQVHVVHGPPAYILTYVLTTYLKQVLPECRRSIITLPNPLHTFTLGLPLEYLVLVFLFFGGLDS